jgi:hypothetical protein
MKKLMVILVSLIAGLLVLNLTMGNFLPFSDAAHEAPLKEAESVKKVGGEIGRFQISTWSTEKRHGYYVLDTTTGEIVGKVAGQ